jgi:ABC-type dipeptide/oligopeptide/nickel transport system permease subunit
VTTDAGTAASAASGTAAATGAVVLASATPDHGPERRRRRRAILAAAVVAFWILLGLLGPLLAPHDPTQIDTSRAVPPPYPPDGEYWWGTDQLGRDIFSRVLVGLRTSVIVGVGVRSLVMVVGVVVGYLAAFSPGWVRSVLLRSIEIMLAFPALLVAMTVTVMLGPSLGTLTLALVIISWPDVARLVYGEALVLRERDFVAASRTFGAGHLHILLRHTLRPMAPQLAVAWSIGIPGAIMYEAGLSYFGFGIQPPTPSLGSLINDGHGYLYAAPWYLVAPTVTLCLLVVSMNLAGEAFAKAVSRRSSSE